MVPENLMRATCRAVCSAARPAFSVGVLFVFLVASVDVLAQASIGSGQIVVKVGDAVPGFPSGTIFSSLGAPSINASGEVAFIARLRGPGITSRTDFTVWAGAPGALRLVAREGERAPGTESGVIFSAFRDGNSVPPVIGADGTVAFAATLSGPEITGANGYGIWRGTSSSVQLVARVGDPAPDTESGTVFASIDFSGTGWAAGESGVVFQSSLSGPAVGSTNNLGIWAGLPGHVGLVARRNQLVSALPGRRITGLTNADPVINNQGETLFRAQLDSSGSAIFLGVPGDLRPVAVSGQLAPEVGAGITFGSMDDSDLYSVNDSGLASFGATLRGGGLMASNNASLWRGDASGRDLVVRSRDLVPGAEPELFGHFNKSAINADGLVAVEANLASASIAWGIWLGEPDALELLAQPGSVVSTGAGDLVVESIAKGPVINAQGQVAFSANVRMTSGGNSKNAILFGRPDDLHAAVVSNEPIDLGADGVQTPSYLHAGFRGPNTGNQDGRVSGFSDNGQVAFFATLPGLGNAIIVTQVPIANRLINGDFETGAISPWSALSGLTVSTANRHSGAYAGRFSPAAAGTTWQQVSVTAGHSYDVDGWVNLPSAGSLTIRVQWRGSSTTTQVVRRLTAATAGWARVTSSAPLVAPAGATAARVQIAVGSRQSACFVDDLVFSER